MRKAKKLMLEHAKACITKIEVETSHIRAKTRLAHEQARELQLLNDRKEKGDPE